MEGKDGGKYYKIRGISNRERVFQKIGKKNIVDYDIMGRIHPKTRKNCG